MTKKIIIIIISLFLLSFAACKRKATVEVGNEGNVEIEVVVAGYTQNIAPYSSSLFEITWNSVAPGSWRLIDLMARPLLYEGYYDSKTITLYDGDYFYWGTGWVLETDKALKKVRERRK